MSFFDRKEKHYVAVIGLGFSCETQIRIDVSSGHQSRNFVEADAKQLAFNLGATFIRLEEKK